MTGQSSSDGTRLTRLEVVVSSMSEDLKTLVSRDKERSKTPWQLITGGIGFVTAAASFGLWIMSGQINNALSPVQLEYAQVKGRVDTMGEVLHSAAEDRGAMSGRIASLERQLIIDETRLQDKNLLPEGKAP